MTGLITPEQIAALLTAPRATERAPVRTDAQIRADFCWHYMQAAATTEIRAHWEQRWLAEKGAPA